MVYNSWKDRKWKGNFTSQSVIGSLTCAQSSLTLALLRCIITEGEVYFDGRPTSRVNLDALRTSITIIPQTVRPSLYVLLATDFHLPIIAA